MKHDAFFPKKSLGQNFLTNAPTQERIVAACDLNKDDIVLEIGPGKAALTRLLAARVKHVLAIEKDDRLAAQLEKDFADTNVTILHSDILEYPFDQLPQPMKIVGNLPFNIATPIIEKVVAFRHKFTEFYMTVQWEYGSRLAAQPGSKDYGSLSCFIQYYAQVQRLFKIPPGSFYPAPKVDSCFLSLKIRNRPLWQVRDEEFLFKLIRGCFSQRRKTIRNSLGAIYPREEMVELLKRSGIDPMKRPEDLSLEEYVRLANTVD